MAIRFPFVQIPPELEKLIGEPDPGTRYYRRSGTREECSQWFDALSELVEAGAGVSPGGVSMYVPVSRAAVHHRLKNGMLTGFSFYVAEDEKSFFGTTRKRKLRPYVYIPASECKAWAEELKRRQGVDEPPQTGEKEGWQFVLEDPKDKGHKEVVYGEKVTREDMIFELQTAMRFMIEEVLAKIPGKLGDKHREQLANGGLSYDRKTKKWSWGTPGSEHRK